VNKTGATWALLVGCDLPSGCHNGFCYCGDARGQMSDDWPSLVTGASFSPFTLSHSAFYALTNTPANTDLALKVASEYLLIKVSCNTMLRSSPDVENQGSNAGQCRISLCIIRHMFMLCIQSGTRRRESPQGLIYIICIISRIFGPKTTNRISTVRFD